MGLYLSGTNIFLPFGVGVGGEGVQLGDDVQGNAPGFLFFSFFFSYFSLSMKLLEKVYGPCAHYHIKNSLWQFWVV